jgi:hypothetical protein
VSNPIDVTFDGEVKLLGHGLSTLEPKAGETLRVETHWRAIAAPSNDYALLLELVDENEELAGRWRLAPFADAYPTSVWQAGEYVRGQHLLLLPTDLPPGRYRLQLALLAPNGRRLFASYAGELSDEPVALGMVEVLDRPRSFSLPEMEHTLRARLGVNARLVGYDLDASHALPGDQVNLTLYWQADGPMVRPFKVFTHLLDGAGEIVVQHDTPPGQGCCPATTWVEGEVIVDPHVLPLPADLVPGTYYVVAGMYDEPTDSRLPAYGADGNKLPEDRVQIAEFVVDQPATPAPPLFEFDYKLYMPLVARE